MMLLRLRRFIDDRRGLAALEFALIAPLLMGLLILGTDGWMRTTQMSAMRSALQSATRYYQLGGADDPTAQTLAMQSWAHAPQDAAVTVTRSCTCGTAPALCSTLCAGSDPPSVYITLASSGTSTGLLQSHAMSQSEVLRVR
jgi:Flp pilus assembly protein TadG